MFKLKINENMVVLDTCSPVLNNNLFEPEKVLSSACIPTCELITNDYPKKATEGEKYINFLAYFLSQTDDENYKLHQRL